MLACLSGYANLYINEVNSTGKWIEIYNSGESSVNVGGYFVSRNNNDGGTNAAVIPYGTTIAAKGFLVLYQGEGAPSPVENAIDCLPFGISSDKFMNSMLKNSAGIVLDVFDIGDPQTVTVNSGKSWARETDGASKIVALDPTPGKSNTFQMPPSELKIYINEVNSTGKWIEFYNEEDVMVNLAGFLLIRTNNDGTNSTFLPPGTMIKPKGYLVIYQGTASGGTALSPVEGAIDCLPFGISSDRFLSATLKDKKGLFTDNTFDIGYPQTVTVNGGKSWAREYDGAEKIVALDPTPGQSNSLEMPPSEFKIYINEVNSTGKWIEFYNDENVSVNMGGYTIIRNNYDGTSIATIPAGATISPKGFLVIYQGIASGGTSPSPVEGAIDCLSYGISSDRFMSAVLKDKKGLIADDSFDIGYPQTVEVIGGKSWARETDGAAKIVALDPTPGKTNSSKLPYSELQIFVNEVNSTGKWIEFYNAEEKAIAMGGFTVTRHNYDGTSVASIPAGAIIAPKGYLVVYQGSAASSPVEGAIDCLTFGISSDRFLSAILKDEKGLIVDDSFDIGYPQTVIVGDGKSWAREIDGSDKIVASDPTPGYPNYVIVNLIEANIENVLASINAGILKLPEKTSSVQVYSVSGNLILNRNLTDTSIDLTYLPKGFYVVKLIVSGKIYCQKIVL